MDDFSGSNVLRRHLDLRKKRAVRNDFVAGDANNDKAYVELPQPVLMLQAAVDGHEDVKVGLGLV
jgi:hypothetical protein